MRPGSPALLLTAVAVIGLTATTAATTAAPASAAADRTFVVDIDSDHDDDTPDTGDTVDADPGDGNCADAADRCSLRAAVMEANALGGATEIRFDHTLRDENGVVVVELSRQGPGENGAETGDLDVTADITILGRDVRRAGPLRLGGLVTSGGDAPAGVGLALRQRAAGPPGPDRTFHVGGGAALTLDDVGIVGGLARDEGAGSGSAAFGGALLVEDATLTARRLGVFGSAAQGDVDPAGGPGNGYAAGGALFAHGSTVDIDDSLFVSTAARAGNGIETAGATGGGDAYGGAIAAFDAATVRLSRTMIGYSGATGGRGANGTTSTDAGRGGGASGGAVYVDDATVIGEDVTILDAGAEGGDGGVGHSPDSTGAGGDGGDGGAGTGGGVHVDTGELILRRTTVVAGDTGRLRLTPPGAHGGVGGDGGDGVASFGGDGGDAGVAVGGGLTWDTGASRVDLTNVTVSGLSAKGGAPGPAGGGDGADPDGSPGSPAGGAGGGVAAGAAATIRTSTLARNTASAPAGVTGGGNLWVFGDGTGGTVAGTMFVDGDPEDCGDNGGGSVTSDGGNLDTDGSCPLAGIELGGTADPGLATDPVLRGGFVPVLPLASDSPAVDVVGECRDAAGDLLGTDARGAPRPYGGACDIGAYEVVDLPLLEIAADTARVPEGRPVGLRVTRHGPADTDVTATTSLSGTVDGDDVSDLPTEFTLPAGETTAHDDVGIVRDGVSEPTELLDLALQGGPGHVVSTLRGHVQVAVLDRPLASIGRVAGAGRIDTAIETSKTGWAAADTVLVARADAYPDALAGAPLATHLDAPILLTPPDHLPDAVLAEIERLGASDAVVLGGTAAVSRAVEGRLASAGLTVDRISGADRFATAAEIAARVVGSGASDTAVYVTEGADDDPGRGWPDALSVSPLAAFTGRPILLVTTDVLPDATATALDDLGVSDVTVVGGSAAVSDDVAGELNARVASLARISGDTRYGTSTEVADRALGAGMRPATTWLATGLDYPDALVAGPAVARGGGVLLLVDRANLSASAATEAWLDDHAGLVDEIRILGGPAAVSDDVATDVENVLSP